MGKPFLEQTLQPGVRVRVTTNHLRVLHSLPHNPMVTPADTPVAPPTSPNCSRQSPPASSTSPQLPPGPPSPSSASWPSSASSPASLHVRGQPLADSANWGVRFTGANAAWDQHMNH